MARIGVFICHCGENIARTVDVSAVSEAARKMPGVVSVLIQVHVLGPGPGDDPQGDRRSCGLTGVVVAACSPRCTRTPSAARRRRRG